MRNMLLLSLGAAVLGCADAPDLQSVAFLSGCWEMSGGPVTIHEHWSKPAGGSMLGYSRTLKAGKEIFHEHMRLDVVDGKVVYHARVGPTPSGTPFTLTRATTTEAVFENPSHDFPKRILYKRTADGLHAQIDAGEGSKKAQQFPMKRVACE